MGPRGKLLTVGTTFEALVNNKVPLARGPLTPPYTSTY